jgi:predicted RNA-binding Zn ribbon-like protein
LSGRYRSALEDDIDSPSQLRAWLHANDLAPVRKVTDEDVAAVASTREALHRMAVAAVRGEAPTRTDVRQLDAVLQTDHGLRITPTAQGVRVNRPASVAEALARLAREAATDLAGSDRGQLRACGDDTCAGIFLDSTGRRRWCSDQQCGNRMRVRAHRARAETR